MGREGRRRRQWSGLSKGLGHGLHGGRCRFRDGQIRFGGGHRFLFGSFLQLRFQGGEFSPHAVQLEAIPFPERSELFTQLPDLISQERGFAVVHTPRTITAEAD